MEFFSYQNFGDFITSALLSLSEFFEKMTQPLSDFVPAVESVIGTASGLEVFLTSAGLTAVFIWLLTKFLL